MNLHTFVSQVWAILQQKGVDAFNKFAGQFPLLVPDFTESIYILTPV